MTIQGSATRLGSSGMLCLALMSCSSGRRDVAPSHTVIGGDVVARVGDVNLPASLVRDVAVAQQTPPSHALALLIDDAVAAQGGANQGFDRTDTVRFARLSVLARVTVARVNTQSHALPPTDDEVRAVSEVHWTEVDRPETMEVIHAVVRFPKKRGPAADAKARDVAMAIAQTEVGASDEQDFQRRAEAVPHDGVELKVETLQPFTADGRIAVAGATGGYDPAFAAGAALLARPGATSGVVESSFGWHVIRLLARRPPKIVPFDERRTTYAEEVYRHRARVAVSALEQARADAEGVTTANGADELMAGVLPLFRSAKPANDDP